MHPNLHVVDDVNVDKLFDKIVLEMDNDEVQIILIVLVFYHVNELVVDHFES
jgi:hypothetical protein